MSNSANGNAEPASQCVEVGTILYTLTKLLSEVQKAIDQRNLDLAREFIERNAATLSLDDNCGIHISDQADRFSNPNVLPLYSLVSFQRYRISELLVDFAVVRMTTPSTYAVVKLAFASFPLHRRLKMRSPLASRLSQRNGFLLNSKSLEKSKQR